MDKTIKPNIKISCRIWGEVKAIATREAVKAEIFGLGTNHAAAHLDNLGDSLAPHLGARAPLMGSRKEHLKKVAKDRERESPA